mmetsp:Transcript_42267/g.64802  ORF Transcript_42267/g.64802 Transcript_42267/m.64802 type:complete len:143 (+) Transcript_42267:424-852(+)|eukprot:CAMPEP_0170505390 /NCGR_PEP_ID=MMETSP0208-20121228/50725_1 /TAXON_ID=197538 /ORGANISM="Strombidium inclinatum, Strain S3" /LENGTH=142 /DNA_ID=CAMNT_0010786217 /DNA_START=370 /DNA_END=798 /DNA_ORIENTATION=-
MAKDGLVEIENMAAMSSTSKNFSELEKGRMMVRFLSKKNNPLGNREFYKYFYKQQEKAEKIDAIKGIMKSVKEVLHPGEESPDPAIKSHLHSQQKIVETPMLNSSNSENRGTPDNTFDALSAELVQRNLDVNRLNSLHFTER